MNEQNEYFYTNNICESLNRTLNLHFLPTKKNFYNFKRAILDVINLYKNKPVYKPHGLSITKILAWWCQNNEITDLLTKKDYNEIVNKYIKYL